MQRKYEKSCILSSLLLDERNEHTFESYARLGPHLAGADDLVLR